MEITDGKMWMVRAGRGGAYAEHFLTSGVVAIGWASMGEIKPDESDADIWQRYAATFPEHNPAQRGNMVGQVKRFLREVAVGDYAVTYDPRQRLYHIGVIRSDAAVQTRMDGEQPRPEYVRRVDWQSDPVPRDALSPGAKQVLAALMTVFRVNDAASQELRGGDPTPAQPPAAAAPTELLPADASELDSAEAAYTLTEYVEKSEQLIEDHIARLDPYQLQDLVAGILRAMGYRTRVSDPGPDRGVDIFASPDGLGLAEPRIFVEVKHRGGAIGAPAVRAFLGGRRPGDRCLYISTGGFTLEARYEADRSAVPVALVAMPELRALLVDFYESLDLVTRDLVPLRRIYWPAEE